MFSHDHGHDNNHSHDHDCGHGCDHASSTLDPYEQVLRYGHLLERISRFQLSSEEALEKGHFRKGAPFVRLKGKNFYINNHFYEITEEIIRLYNEEIKNICPSCDIPKVDEVNRKAKDLVAQGWLGYAGQGVAQNMVGRYGGDFVDLGARYGPTAGLLKVAGELAEDALLIIFKLPGAHFLCEVVTMTISYYSGGVLSLYRTFARASAMKRNGFRHLVRLTTTSWVVRRALRGLRTDFGPVVVDPALMEGGQPVGEQKQWLAQAIVGQKSYARFFKKAQERLNLYGEKLSQLEKELKEAKGFSARRIEKKIEKLRWKRARLTKVNRKIFEGRRRGIPSGLLFPPLAPLILFKHNKTMTLSKGLPPPSGALGGTKAWMIPLTAHVTEPGFLFDPDRQEERQDFVRRVSAHQSVLAPSQINEILLGEASQKMGNVESLKGLLADVEFIFETEASIHERYLHVHLIHGFLGQFMPQLAKSYLGSIRQQMFEKDYSFKNIRRFFRLQWKAGRLTYFNNLFVDYLRAASLVKGSSPFVWEKDLAKDYLIRLMGAYEILGQLKEMPSPEELERVDQALKEKNRELETHRFWLEKRATHKFLPLRPLLASALGLGSYNLSRRRPQCSRLY